MCKLCWSISTALVVIVSLISYKFILSSEMIESTDNRQAIVLSNTDRNLVLEEMRLFLSNLQKITKGIAKDDMATVIKAAREVGLAAQPTPPKSLVAKLPLAFKKLGSDTHRKFDELAQDAEDLGDSQYALEQLSTLMNNCVACHATYKINNVQN